VHVQLRCWGRDLDPRLETGPDARRPSAEAGGGRRSTATSISGQAHEVRRGASLSSSDRSRPKSPCTGRWRALAARARNRNNATVILPAAGTWPGSFAGEPAGAAFRGWPATLPSLTAARARPNASRALRCFAEPSAADGALATILVVDCSTSAALAAMRALRLLTRCAPMARAKCAALTTCCRPDTRSTATVL
jgi:hypothetical protein